MPSGPMGLLRLRTDSKVGLWSRSCDFGCGSSKLCSLCLGPHIAHPGPTPPRAQGVFALAPGESRTLAVLGFVFEEPIRPLPPKPAAPSPEEAPAAAQPAPVVKGPQQGPPQGEGGLPAAEAPAGPSAKPSAPSGDYEGLVEEEEEGASGSGSEGRAPIGPAMAPAIGPDAGRAASAEPLNGEAGVSGRGADEGEGREGDGGDEAGEAAQRE